MLFSSLFNHRLIVAVIFSFIFKEVDLIPNGSKIEVTKENKMKYLDALAQYKLHTRVSTEIEAFVKGNNQR